MVYMLAMDQSESLERGTMLSTKRLKMAGWLAMASSLLTLPWFLFTYMLANRNDLAVKIAEGSMLVGSMALLIYLLLTFQLLLNRRYLFHGADKTISLLIQSTIIQTSASILALVVPELKAAVGLFSLVMVVIVGILHIMFGIWLLHLPASLGGMHRPYCWLNIITGFALATIMLLPLGMLTSAIADVMLATIFLQSARPSRQLLAS